MAVERRRAQATALAVFAATLAPLSALGDVRRADPSVAPAARPSASSEYALIVYVTPAGDIQVGSKTVSEAQITELSRKRAAAAAKPKLLIRASREATVRAIKRVTKAAAAGGITLVVFSSWKDGPQSP